MRSVAREAPLALERLVQSVQQAVEGAAEIFQLIPRAGSRQPLPEVGSAQVVSIRIRNLIGQQTHLPRAEMRHDQRVAQAVLRLLADYAPFPIPPSFPAVELAEGGRIDLGSLRLEVLHTPGHTEGSCCLFERESGTLFSGDTLFRSGWGRTDLPGGSEDQMADSLARLSRLEDALRVLPGHGRPTTIGEERAWLDLVAREHRLIA